MWSIRTTEKDMDFQSKVVSALSAAKGSCSGCCENSRVVVLFESEVIATMIWYEHDKWIFLIILRTQPPAEYG